MSNLQHTNYTNRIFKQKYLLLKRKQHKNSSKHVTSIFKYSKSRSSLTLFNKFNQTIPLNFIVKLKKFLKKKQLKKRNLRIYLLLQINTSLSLKTKNSRMGKGVGLNTQINSLVTKKTPIVIIRNCCPTRGKYFTHKIYTHTGLELKLCLNNQ